MKSAPAWILYTVYRILLFVVPLVILLVLRIEPWLSTLLAAVIGLCLSYIFLRSPREEVARDLYAATHREKSVVKTDDGDDETEDAAVDLAQARRADAEDVTAWTAEPTPASERERGAEQDSVSQTGEAGEFKGEDKLR
ncbi:MAG TPA: DUF4229 domain-containing protein [Glaciibacter sp.]|nr:DUF4229 domain-containing protein [Glaciibacter sp.]